MAKRNSRKMRKTRRRSGARKMRGGAWGQGWRNEAEMIAPGYPVIGGYPSCGALSRPGMLTEGDVPKGGLPGLTGGGRRRRGTMRGGRYTTDLAGTAADFGASLGPRGGMVADTMRIAGETGGSPTPCSAPAGAAAAPTPMAGAGEGILPGFMKGGAQLAPAPFLQEQTAGYTFEPSKFLDSVGAPIALRTPVGGQLDVPACKTTGGGSKFVVGDTVKLSALALKDKDFRRIHPTLNASSVGTITGYVGIPGYVAPVNPLENKNAFAGVYDVDFNGTIIKLGDMMLEKATNGGRRRRSVRRASRKAVKGSRKNRKSSRKNRKASRKNRK